MPAIVSSICHQIKPSFKNPIKRWSERQDSNLPQTGENKGNQKPDTQGDAQAPVSAWRDLSLVVATWPKIPAALKQAILSIVSAVNSQPEGKQ